jgi:hypothetical protein
MGATFVGAGVALVDDRVLVDVADEVVVVALAERASTHISIIGK